MLARLNVRNKLLVVLLPLLVAVAVLASIGVFDRLDARDRARQDQELVATARSAAELINRLQLERLDAVARRSALASDIADAQAGTDAAGAALLERLEGIGDLDVELDGRSIEQVHDGVARWIERLGDLRSSVSAGTITATGADSEYSSIIEALLDTTRHLVAAGSAQDRAGASSRWMTSLTESDAHAGSLAIIVAAGTRDGILAEVAPVTAELAEQRSLSASWTAVYLADTDQAGRSTFDSLVANDTFVETQVPFTNLNDVDPGVGISEDPAVFLSATVRRIGVLWDVQQGLLDEAIHRAQVRVAELERQVRFYVGGSVSALLLGLLLAAVVTRLITTSLRRLTRAARTISGESLPRLVESLKQPETELGLHPTPIDVRGSDEFVELANAFGAVEQTAIDVAAEQAATLRKGISDIFVNLARRNQSLLDRQIEFIDRLEANEEDPDQLENLFKLDHLATRMRRNAESLLVLAGAEAPRRRGREVSMADVIRVAVGEVEDFARVTLLAVDDAMVIGSAAVDIAHLLSELMENGTQYSPPDRRVEVVGHRTKDGGYVISVADHGVGMSEEARRAANELLAKPPAVGLALSRSLGFIVASTLAARHQIEVRLTDSPSGGVTALVTLPPSLIHQPDEDDGLHTPALSRSTAPDGSVDPDAGVGAPALGVQGEDDWMASLPPLFADDAEDAREPEPLVAEFPVASAETERPAWKGEPDRAAPRSEPLSLGDDPFAGMDDATRPVPAPSEGSGELEAPLVPTASVDGAGANEPDAVPPAREASVSFRDLGAAFEAGLYSLLDGPRDGQGEDEPEGRPGAPERRTTMWSAPARPASDRPLPPLPGIPTPGSLPTSIPPSISADLSPAAPTPPPLPSRTDQPMPVAPPMEPLVGNGAPTSRAHPADPEAPAVPIVPGPLPKRRVATAQVSFPAAGEVRVGAPNRPADEIRSILSAYRSGLSTGRTEAQADDELLADVPPSNGASEAASEEPVVEDRAGGVGDDAVDEIADGRVDGVAAGPVEDPADDPAQDAAGPVVGEDGDAAAAEADGHATDDEPVAEHLAAPVDFPQPPPLPQPPPIPTASVQEAPASPTDAPAMTSRLPEPVVRQPLFGRSSSPTGEAVSPAVPTAGAPSPVTLFGHGAPSDPIPTNE